MEFKNLKKLMQENFKEVTSNINYLFEVDVDKDEMWDLYLNSFPSGTNEIYREKREYDCSCCKQFIKNFGNVVFLKDNKIKTIWEIETNELKFQPVMNALNDYIKSKLISNVYISKFNKIGVNKNFEKLEDRIVEWDHLYLELPSKFVDKSGKSEGEIKGFHRTNRDVFKRSLEELTEESVLVTLELIAQNSIYKGKEWENSLKQFLKYLSL